MGIDANEKPYVTFVSTSETGNLMVTAAAVTALVPGVWTQLTAICNADAKTLALYVNGVLAKSVGIGGALPAAAVPGMVRIVVGDDLQGQIENLRLYSVVHLPGDANQIDANGFESTAGLVAAYRFDDGGTRD